MAYEIRKTMSVRQEGMILTCPSCEAQFRVDAAMIPAEGRQVRCASCKHQWHAFAQGQTAELTPPPVPSDSISEAEEEVSRLIAYPDAQDLVEELEPEEEPASAREDVLPEDAFTGDADFMRDLPQESEEDAEEDDHEPELISAIAPDVNAFLDEEEEPDTAPRRKSVKPLAALAALLLIAVITTSFFALRPVMQGPFGFVYSLFGAHPSDGLALAQVNVRERPSRSKARFTVEGQIVNGASEMRHVPMIRIAIIGKDGKVLQEREYEDTSAPTLQAGESYAFKASNLELDSKDDIAWFVVDIGAGGELMLRRPAEGLPNG